MDLHRLAREYYTIIINTTPAVASWDASFDDGTNWPTGEALGTITADDGTTGPGFRWLLAGADATIGAAVAQISGDVTPMARATDNPEILVREDSMPRVYYKT